jgi:hypothetical protein
MSGTAPPEDASTRVLDVWLEGGLPDTPHRVGTLRASAGTGYAITFTYAADYLASDRAVPLPPSMPGASLPPPRNSAAGSAASRTMRWRATGRGG